MDTVLPNHPQPRPTRPIRPRHHEQVHWEGTDAFPPHFHLTHSVRRRLTEQGRIFSTGTQANTNGNGRACIYLRMCYAAGESEGAIGGDSSLARRQHLYDCPQLFVAQRFFPKCELQVGGNLGEDFYC